jgi:hypothetical protein
MAGIGVLGEHRAAQAAGFAQGDVVDGDDAHWTIPASSLPTIRSSQLILSTCTN